MSKSKSTRTRRNRRSITEQANLFLSRLSSEPLLIEQSYLFGMMAEFSAIADSGSIDLEQNKTSSLFSPSNSLSSRSAKIGTSAVLCVEGFIEPKESYWTRWGYGTALSTFCSDLKEVGNDSEIDTIYIYFDTPGGIATGNEEASQLIYEIGKNKDTIGVGEGLVASAGYYLYSATNKKIATPSTKLGSIGSMLVHEEWSKAFEEYGIKHELLTFGKRKADGNHYQPLDESSREALQERVDAAGMQFVTAVARYQGISVEDVRQNYGDGKVFLADEAKRRGMVDAIGTFSLTTARLTTQTENSGADVEIDNAAPEGSNRDVELKIELKETNGPGQSTGTNEPDRQNESQTNRQKNETSGDSENSNEGYQMKFSNKVKCAMYVFGLIKSNDTSDEVCEAALSGYCLSKSIDMPEENANDDTIIAIFNPTPESNTGQETQETNETTAESRKDALSGAVQSLANVGVEISAVQFNEAIESTDPVDKIIASWTSEGSEQHSTGGGQLPGQVRITGHSEEKFHDAAVNRILDIVGCGGKRLGDETENSLRNWSAQHIFEECMARMGMPHQRGGDWNMDFENAMLHNMDFGKTQLLSQSLNSVPGHNKPSDLSFVVGAAINLMFDNAMDTKRTTYKRWSGKIAATSNLDPTQMVALSSATTLDQVIGTQEAHEFAFEQELLGHLFVKGFHNFVAITFEMSLGNNIQELYDRISAMSQAVELTDQELAIKALTSTEDFADTGNPFFHSSRGNLFSPGAAPSNAQAEKHENAFINRKGVGTNPKRLNLMPAFCLVPTDQKQAAKQTFQDAATLKELLQKTSDGDINTHRDTVDIIVEPDLNDYDSKAWYTGTNPETHPAIVMQYLSQYGEGGQRSQSVDADRRCVKYHLKHAAGAGVKNWRYMNKDDGQ